MPEIAFAGPAQTATMHRDDAPVGRTAQFHLRKRFGGLNCCRRSWSDNGKRLFLHGYALSFEIEFACAETESGDQVLGAECLADIRAALQGQYAHTTLITANDPQRDLFELLAERDLVDMRIVDSAGLEASAAWVFETVEKIVARATEGRVWVSRIDAQESGSRVLTLTALPVKDWT
ncbi:6-carboxytetrahydropterin synthase [Mycobacterium sp. TY815]|uniref:6-carboxytetrahydropterin synthase n=1 Tax=Mycobacterium sp. TY815 TaxID=3050581 RepID=UPI0027408AFB|nr:6-carboxytetrahydropterin synthase [Mycobacterium sp. TY815]MDP7706252.1 6-carboxytetrahydropterin synthase [Mycobacterium sp. TY815]